MTRLNSNLVDIIKGYRHHLIPMKIDEGKEVNNLPHLSYATISQGTQIVEEGHFLSLSFFFYQRKQLLLMNYFQKPKRLCTYFQPSPILPGSHTAPPGEGI